MEFIFVVFHTGDSWGGQRHQLAVHVQLGLIVAAAHLWHSGPQQRKQDKQQHQYSCLTYCNLPQLIVA